MALLVIAIAFLALFGQYSLGVPIEEVKGLSERIVGGVDAESTPHMAALVFGQLILSQVCGGSVVSSSCILTAAHCITAFMTWDGNLLESYAGVVGTNQWNSINNLVSFEHSVIHPDYDSGLLKNDIAVLFLAEKLQYNDKVKPVPLGSNYVGGGVKVYATGWGTLWIFGPTPENLQKIYLTTIDGQECSERMAALPGWSHPVDHHVEICTLHSPGHGMCHGDSGSALVDVLTGEQIGIVSWGEPCARGSPDVYVRVSAYVDFLNLTLEHD